MSTVRRLHTAEQAAEILQCKASWLEEQARLRRIPFAMIGGSYRWSDEHLDEAIRIFEERPEGQRAPATRQRRAAPVAPPTDGTTQLRAHRPRRPARDIKAPRPAQSG